MCPYLYLIVFIFALHTCEAKAQPCPGYTSTKHLHEIPSARGHQSPSKVEGGSISVTIVYKGLKQATVKENLYTLQSHVAVWGTRRCFLKTSQGFPLGEGSPAT